MSEGKNMSDFLEILRSITPSIDLTSIEIIPFKSLEDGQDYEVWKIATSEKNYVLKKTKGYEFSIYSGFFCKNPCGVPRIYGSTTYNNENYILMEFLEGESKVKLDRQSLKKALDALILIQNEFWEAQGMDSFGLSFSESLKQRRERGNYIKNPNISSAYSDFLELYEALPRTLCHDDLLPFNLLISEKNAAIIDWEIAGILPYPASFARLIAHAEQTDDSFFYIKDEDKEFAIDYYYQNLVKSKGISYQGFRYALELFLLYEYCEWIMIGVKYEDADIERYEKYLKKAQKLCASIGLPKDS